MLTIQMLKIFDKLLKDEGLDLRFTFYNVLATHYKVGLIEVVPKANTVANIQKEKAFTSATSAFQKGYLRFRLLSIDFRLFIKLFLIIFISIQPVPYFNGFENRIRTKNNN